MTAPAPAAAPVISQPDPPAKWHRLAIFAIAVVFLVRIVLLYRVFNDTLDESLHIAAGLEFLERGKYTFEPQHPPLARVTVAVLPYLFGGLRLGSAKTLWSGGPWDSSDLAFYWRTLSLARAGNLIFAVLLFYFVYRWSLLLFGGRAALAACAIAACCPNLIAHASLATLDLAAAATILMTAYFFWRWTETPGWRYCVASACALGAAILCKFTSLVFVPPLALVYILTGRWKRFELRRGLLPVAVCCALAAAVVWAGYGFDFGSVAPSGHVYYTPFALRLDSGMPQRLGRALGGTSLPAPRFWQGLIDVLGHNQAGHLAYLLGVWSDLGWWYYFPIAVGLKTTLPMLLLVGLGVWLILSRRGPRAALYPIWGLAIVMAVAMSGNLNIGIRHVLVIYPLFAILAGGIWSAVYGLPAWGRLRTLALVLLVWHVAESVYVHPDYLAYFNEIARGREERFLADSNLDWGQDLGRLARYAREHRLENVQLAYFGSASPAKLGVPHAALAWDHPQPGWVAVSVNFVLGIGETIERSRWLRQREPDARIGKSIWLYRISSRQSQPHP